MNYFAYLHAKYAQDAAPPSHFPRYHKHGTVEHCKYLAQLLQGIFGGTPRKEDWVKLVKECSDVSASYANLDGTKKPGWLKAPNGQPSNLPECLWLLVRTKLFKKWFGDWEKIAVANAVLADENIVAPGILLRLPQDKQRVAAKQIYDEIKARGPIMSPDGRVINFKSRGFKEAKYHSADPHTLAVMEILPKIISSMRYLKKGDVKKKEKDVIAYHIYARRVNLGDGDMIARIVIREDKNGNMFYDDDATTLEMIKGIYSQEPRKPNPGNDQDSLYAEHSLADFFDEVNRESAKIAGQLDANGEPII